MKKDKKIYTSGNRVNGELIKEKLKEKRMSERYASRQIGCSYNALNRNLKENWLNLLE